jgi:response regulator of citrate/malate metabolism
LEAGFAEHLVKPVKIDKLEEAIARTVAASEPPVNG